MNWVGPGLLRRGLVGATKVWRRSRVAALRVGLETESRLEEELGLELARGSARLSVCVSEEGGGRDREGEREGGTERERER